MKVRLCALTALAIVCSVFYISCSHSPVDRYLSQRDPASIGKEERKFLNEIVKLSSAELEVSESRLLIDNDAAFDAKLEAIRGAQAGETIRMIYYIYSDQVEADVTTSVFSNELILAAKRGVKVKLLLDYFTNYKMLDHLSYLESASNGNIQVKLYGRPSELILRDLYYIAQPCPTASEKPSSTECAEVKWNTYNQYAKNHGQPLEFADFYSSLVAAGLYSKSAALLQTGILSGAEIDVDSFKNGTSNPEQAEAFKDLIRTVYDAKIKKNPTAYLKLSMAMVLYPGQVNPALNLIYGALPLEQMENSGSGKHWEHLTDFMHQKLLLVGERYLQLGGRNIADSYHMKQNSLSAKYTFMDTDIEAKISTGGNAVVDSFERAWDFEAMSADLKTVQKFMPFEFVANADLLPEVTKLCKKELNRNERANCITKNLRADKNYKTVAQRMMAQRKNMESQVKLYETKYAPKKAYTESYLGQAYKTMKNYDDHLALSKTEPPFISYVENVHYSPKNPEKRVFGGIVDRELEGGKMKHAVWVQALENACRTSSEMDTEKRVIFHSAYWLPPANLLKVFASMINGDWNCSKVRVTIVSNSFETTDLNVINVFAKYQMKAFFDLYHQRQKAFGKEGLKKAAQFEYYEYQKPKNASASQVKSLHTKLTVIGDSVMVGSANADVRSFYMDANNGLFIHGAEDFTNHYIKWMDSILADKSVVKNVTRQFMQPLKTLNQYDSQFMDALRARFKSVQKIPSKYFNELKKTQAELGNELYRSTMAMLNDGAIDQMGLVRWRPGMDVDRSYDKARQKIEKEFNRAFMLF